MKAIDDHLAGNPSIAYDRELYRLTYQAFENLFALRKAIAGDVGDHLPDSLP